MSHMKWCRKCLICHKATEGRLKVCRSCKNTQEVHKSIQNSHLDPYLKSLIRGARKRK